MNETNGATDTPKPMQQAEDVPHLSKTDAQIQAAYIGTPTRLNQPILIVEYDPQWPQLYEREAARIRAALGHHALSIEHVGSTSVPGLSAKPIIDILLAVADSAVEAAYVPALEAVGYVLQIREPDWYEHRMLKGPDTDINLHVLSQGCPEIERMLLFRNFLRRNPDARRLYEQTKRELAGQPWKYMQNYADAKSAVVAEIMARAQKAAEPNPNRVINSDL